MRSTLLLIVILLLSLGGVIIYSTTSADALDHLLGQDSNWIILKQMVYAGFGAFLGYVVYKIGIRKWIDSSPLLLALLTLFLVLVLIPA